MPGPASPAVPEVRTEFRVGRDGTGVLGNTDRSALGAHSSVTNVEQHFHPPGRTAVVWPVAVGQIPQLASASQPRAVLREQVDSARSAGGSVVLTQVLSGGGGVGKTQLAAAYAVEALQEERADLVVWATAMDEQQIVTEYARAAVLVEAPGAEGSDPETDARAFLAWLATTERRWLVVLDNIAGPEAVRRWWPPAGGTGSGSGWVLATTRLEDAYFTGGGRTRVRVGVYTPGEAQAYLRERLAAEDAGHLLDERAGDLAEALGYLPLALGHAAALMINEDLSCTGYVELFTDRRARLGDMLPASADTEGYGREIATTLVLALDAARAGDPSGLAGPVLHLVSLLDPAGHPAALWETEPVVGHLARNARREDADADPPGTGERESRRPAPGEVRRALRLLHRYALISHHGEGPRAVRIHALTARAVRETLDDARLGMLATTAADGLLAAWPDPDTGPAHRSLATALRANADALHHHSGDHLWHPDAHVLLFKTCHSLDDGGLYAAAVAHWREMTVRSERVLGPDHPHTLSTCGSLGGAYQQVGRTDEAIHLLEPLHADCERVLGREHPNTLAIRGNLATCYWQAGRISEAVRIEEQLLAIRERVHGPEHPDTLTTLNNLAGSYLMADRTDEAVDLFEQAHTGRERVLGREHPDALTTRGNLAYAYRKAGRNDEAIRIEEQLLPTRERVLGPDHPDTLTTRNNLAHAYRRAGRDEEAVRLFEQVLADSRRVLGPDHPDTASAKETLAAWRKGPDAGGM
ncbi:tetratricopeptide repeat protein [Streptomyces yaizuensis]|uniref:Tetratricopeptide repeat protein n=1 Tax=Streptomyces yaizuensis TaxID=2989713 RepID=A0ABQ5PAM4_9ACTN|nr:tetratricopeptide repeat protein [Streptomyces sp. YSPA8]GLF99607.1 tetratricopeptide repeat protein [Streptomyces sp. YSPA8]